MGSVAFTVFARHSRSLPACSLAHPPPFSLQKTQANTHNRRSPRSGVPHWTPLSGNLSYQGFVSSRKHSSVVNRGRYHLVPGIWITCVRPHDDPAPIGRSPYDLSYRTDNKSCHTGRFNPQDPRRRTRQAATLIC